MAHPLPISHTLLGPLLLLLLPLLLQASPPHPHVLVIMADDMGYSDVGYRDSNMHTPNIDRMAKKGVKLTNSYMTYACTPSRAAFLTSMYGFRMGLQTQTMVFGAARNNTLPLSFKMLPEHLQKAGYKTHYVGKWHLGFCNKSSTPTGRGFDSFYGMYNGLGDYFTHLSKKNWYDFHLDEGSNFTIDKSANGSYSTFLFTKRTVDILRKHDKDTPLFIFLSYQAVHGPLQVPKKYKTKYCAQWKDNPNRQTVCGMMAAVDKGIGTIRRKLKKFGYEDDVIIIFLSDNGGPAGPTGKGYSNYPLRGGKKTLWEGGTKVQTIIHSKTYLPNAPYEWNGLMHVVDWMPTLVEATGISVDLGKVDGVNNWNSIVNKTDSQREEFVYNIDLGKKNTSAIRWRQYKLINNKPGAPDGWYNPAGAGSYNKSGVKDYPEFSLFDVEADPSEKVELLTEGSEDQKEKIDQAFATMKKKLADYKTQVQPPMVSVPITDIDTGPQAWQTGWCEATP